MKPKKPAISQAVWRPAAVVLAVCFAGFGCARGSATPSTETTNIVSGTIHLGDDYLQDYPEAAEPQGPHTKLVFMVRHRPKSARLTIEAADVDMAGCDVWLNGQRIGEFAVAHEWRTNAFDMLSKDFLTGQNNVMIRTKMLTETQAEDFFVRNGVLTMEH